MLEKMNIVNVGVWSVFENDAVMYQWWHWQMS